MTVKYFTSVKCTLKFVKDEVFKLGKLYFLNKPICVSNWHSIPNIRFVKIHYIITYRFSFTCCNSIFMSSQRWCSWRPREDFFGIPDNTVYVYSCETSHRYSLSFRYKWRSRSSLKNKLIKIIRARHKNLTKTSWKVKKKKKKKKSCTKTPSLSKQPAGSLPPPARVVGAILLAVYSG